MFFNDKKKAATIILSKIKKDGSSSESESKPGSDEPDVYRELAETIKGGDVGAIAASLKAFHEMIAEEDEEQDSEG